MRFKYNHISINIFPTTYKYTTDWLQVIIYKKKLEYFFAEIFSFGFALEYHKKF